MVNPLLDPNARIVIGHRGNRVRAPENTVEGLLEAMAVGADAVEFDVRTTRDGVPVLLHDPDLDRTTDHQGLLRTRDFAEVEGISVRLPGAAAPHGQQPRIPSLEQALDALRDAPLVIEIKEVEAVEPAERLIAKFNAQGRVVLGSGNDTVSERLYRSSLKTCASMRDAIGLIPLALLGLRPARPRFDVLSVTPRFHGAPIPVVRMAVAAQKVGVPTQAWTVNDPAVARRFWAGGVAAIVTDDPAAMVRARTQ